MFNVFPRSYHHHHLIPEYFYHPQKETHAHQQSFPIPHSSHPPATVNLVSVSMDLPPEERNGHPLQYSCLENSMDRGGWQATVDGLAKTWT